MSILMEVIKNFRRLDNETPDAEAPSDSIDDENEDDLELDLPSEIDGEGDENIEGNPEDADNPDDISLTGEDPQIDQDMPDPNMPADGAGAEGGDDLTLDGEGGELGGDMDQTPDDPNKQGVLRTVKNAHLVYKRENGDGGFEELWIYNIGTLKDELETRKAILAGTDIPVSKTSSEDGSQTYTIWSAGNAELIHVTGLQN